MRLKKTYDRNIELLSYQQSQVKTDNITNFSHRLSEESSELPLDSRYSNEE